MMNLGNFRQAVKCPKTWNSMGYFCPKNTFLQLKDYIQRIITLLSTTHQIPFMSFLNHKSFFSTKLPCIFWFSKLDTFGKSSPWKCKFSDFPLLVLKFTKFLLSFFKQKVSFSSKFWSLFSVMRDNSNVFFLLKFYMLLTKVVHQSAKFQTCQSSH